MPRDPKHHLPRRDKVTDWRNVDWRGPIAFVLAVGVSATLVGGILSAELSPGKVTSQEVSFFSTLGGAIVGAIATYLGVQYKAKGDDVQDETTPDEPVEPEVEPEPPEPVPEPEVEPSGQPEHAPETRSAPREGQPWGLSDYREGGGENGS